MERVKFSEEYLAELGFYAPAEHKLVYMFVLVFRGCHKEEIAPALGLQREVVMKALHSLQEKELITIDRRNRCRLPSLRELPLERFAKYQDPDPAWYYSGD